jgi:hypothetical protein
MNTHLNIYKNYTSNSESYQIENNLTRALAITLQEDALFMHEFLMYIFSGTKFYFQFFESTNENTPAINIEIQKKTNTISDFEHIFAITLSETAISDFWNANHHEVYDAICDLVIQIDNVYIIIEVKRDGVDATAQLYNQIFNIIKSADVVEFLDKEKYDYKITILNEFTWHELMKIASKVYNFEKAKQVKTRFLEDFITLIREHNFRWLPEVPISNLKPNNTNAIKRRMENAIFESRNLFNLTPLNYSSRSGIIINKTWAQEILFHVNENGGLNITVYPGNTKSQGYELFNNNVEFKSALTINGKSYDIEKRYHIKFTSFQKYFSGLWFQKYDLITERNLYSKENFYKYTGRKKREEWGEIEQLFNDTLLFNWKEQCSWNELMLDSGKNQFDISFGYELNITIPFEDLKTIDKEQRFIVPLSELIYESYQQISENLFEE